VLGWSGGECKFGVMCSTLGVRAASTPLTTWMRSSIVSSLLAPSGASQSLSRSAKCAGEHTCPLLSVTVLPFAPGPLVGGARMHRLDELSVLLWIRAGRAAARRLSWRDGSVRVDPNCPDDARLGFLVSISQGWLVSDRH